MNTLELGSLALSRAIYEYQKLGYKVSIPLIDAQDYDLVIEKENKFYSVQCKYTSVKSDYNDNIFCVGLRSIKTNTKETITRNRGQYDILFVMCVNNVCYSIPSDCLSDTGVNVGGPKFKEYELS